MTAYATKTSVMAVRAEASDSTLLEPNAGGLFLPIREGFSFQGAFDTVESDELVGSLAGGASFTTKETPAGSMPLYFKHSGTAGTAPSFETLLKSALGTQSDAGAEYDTVNSSSAGTASARAVINVGGGEGASYEVGEALLIKDGANGYNIRNIYSIATDALTLNKNLGSAPSSGIDLGQANFFHPATSGHPTYSAWHYQNKTLANNAFTQAMAGCRTTNTTITIQANGLAEIAFDFEGTKFYYNPIEITSSNKYIDITDDGGTIEVTLTEGWYKTPKALATHITTKATAASVGSGNDTITCTFSSTTGKFTLASNGSTFSLLWQSGSNTANSVGATLGFTVSANDTGSTSYVADSAITYGTSQTPAFDDIDPFVCKWQELLIGDYTRTDCRKATNITLTIATPKQDVESLCAESGVSESVTLERTTTFSATLHMTKHEVDEMDDFFNNTLTEVQFNGGVKDSSGNWVAGKCVNFWLPLVNITANVVDQQDGLYVVNVEGRARANSTFEDVYINFV